MRIPTLPICDFNGLFIAGMAASHSESAIKPLIANEWNSADFSECALINQAILPDLETGALAIELHS
jgi:hypothetical protein